LPTESVLRSKSARQSRYAYIERKAFDEVSGLMRKPPEDAILKYGPGYITERNTSILLKRVQLIMPIVEEIFSITFHEGLKFVVGLEYDEKKLSFSKFIGYRGVALSENNIVCIGLYDFSNTTGYLNDVLFAHEISHVAATKSKTIDRTKSISRILDEGISELVATFVALKINEEPYLFGGLKWDDVLVRIMQHSLVGNPAPHSLKNEWPKTRFFKPGYDEIHGSQKQAEQFVDKLHDMVKLSRQKIRTAEEARQLAILSRNPQSIAKLNDPALNSKLPVVTASDETWSVAGPLITHRHFYGNLIAAMCTYAKIEPGSYITIPDIKSMISILKDVNAAFEVLKGIEVQKFISEYVMSVRIRE
jgi:hypothetical protein